MQTSTNGPEYYGRDAVFGQETGVGRSVLTTYGDLSSRDLQGEL